MFKLSKLGYGSIVELERMTSIKILQLLNFERFNIDYENVIYQKKKRENGG